MIYLFYLLFAAACGFGLCWLIRRDPEVVAQYKEFETFKEYAEATEALIEEIPHNHPLRLMLLLDSVSILSAYKRDAAMRVLQNATIFKYNSMSLIYQGKFPILDRKFGRLRDARRQVMVAIRKIYGESK